MKNSLLIPVAYAGARFCAGLLAASPELAYAASTVNVAVTVTNTIPALSVICPTSAQADFIGPLPPGYIVCTVFMLPTNWTGTITLGGANANLFVVNASNNVVVGPNPVPAGTYDFTVTLTP